MIGTRSKKSAETEQERFERFKREQTPYAGCIDGVPVETAPHVLVSGPTGRGKLLRLSEPIPTPTGFTRMGDLRVGDLVIGRDGSPYPVEHVWRVNETPDLHRITLSDGQTVICDAEHQWVVSDSAGRNDGRDSARVAAIRRWEQAQTVIADLEALADRCEPGERTLAELSEFVSNEVPDCLPFVPSGANLKAALDQVDTPYELRRQTYTRDYRAMTLPPQLIGASYPVRQSLEVLRDKWARSNQAVSRSRSDAADALLAELGPADESWLKLGELVDALAARGAKWKGYRIDGPKARFTQTMTKWLKDAGVEARGGRIVEGVRRVEASRQVVTSSAPVRFYETRVAITALALRLRDRFELRPTAEAVEQTLTTEEILSAGLRGRGNQAKWAVRVTEPLDLPETDLPLDPYVLGAWLGDGHTDSAEFSQSGKPLADGPSDMDHLVAQLAVNGYETTINRGENRIGTIGLREDLEAAGVLGRKHIPMAYLRSSLRQRLALLQGLMDTDGTIDTGGRSVIGLSDLRLAEDVAALVRSLGIKASVRWNLKKTYVHNGAKQYGKPHHQISFTTKQSVFRLPRKAERVPRNLRETQQWLYILNIEPIEPGHPEYEAGRCITVASPDSTYLTGTGFIPTHNTTRILAPGALLWRGPRVLVSSKTDYLKWVVEKGIAKRGPLYVMDLAGELDTSFDWLQGLDYTMVTSDPTALITNDDDALAMASLLMKVGQLGASDSGGGGGSDAGAFWQTLTAQSLAALLLAGQASGEGIDWSLRAAGRTKGDGVEDTAPSWVRAHALIENTSTHAFDLRAKVELDPKMKDSIRATMQTGLAPWLLSNVSGRDGDAKPFSPKMLEEAGEPTLAIIAPADGVAAGAAVAVVETIIRHWRRGIERGLDRVLLSIDEAVNTCPIPKLPTYITEARGLGVACVVAVQSSNQMVLRWGRDGADVLREVFPAALILEGAPEREMLENAAWWEGEEDRWTESIDGGGGRSLSAERASYATKRLLPQSVEEGRLLLYGRKGKKVELPGIWQF